jgi:[ribosomal protein S5]-alanine N-acetyltransferase
MLETERLLLRLLRPGDEDAVHALLSDERVVRHMLFPLFTRERAARFVERLGEGAPPPPADGLRQVVLALVDRGDDALVGLCGLVLKPELEEGELWYLLRPDRWGRGLVAEGAARLVEHGFRDLALHRVWASCLPENPASARVLEKMGFRREGLLRQNLRIHGAWRDSCLYAALADEWPRTAAAGATD